MIVQKTTLGRMLHVALVATYAAALPAHAFGTGDDRVETPLYSEFKKLDRNDDGSVSTRKPEAQAFQANATLSSTRVPKRSEERATALPPSAR